MDWTGSGVVATETSDGRRAWVGPQLPAQTRSPATSGSTSSS